MMSSLEDRFKDAADVLGVYVETRRAAIETGKDISEVFQRIVDQRFDALANIYGRMNVKQKDATRDTFVALVIGLYG